MRHSRVALHPFARAARVVVTLDPIANPPPIPAVPPNILIEISQPWIVKPAAPAHARRNDDQE
ncbi:hypothetical protein GCM10009102_22600 [Sphingomonas insulae]|uniref:Uncharacterized protein n=1 Tax=Sphingomonas insulae TaxID=424800 RepID=A0ABN1HWT4_9SPHN